MSGRGFSISRLGEVMKVQPSELWRMAEHSDLYFRPTRYENVKGKIRVLDVPKYWYGAKLRKANRYLQGAFALDSAAHGGRPNHSAFSSANRHLGRDAVASLDIKDCYPAITREMMSRALNDLGLSKDAVQVLSGLFTVRNRIPQGSPLSSIALNLFFCSFDRKTRRCAERKAISYTRFCDDFQISGKRAVVLEFRDNIQGRLEEMGLRISEEKKKLRGLQTCEQDMLVHHIRVNNSNGCAIPEDLEASARKAAISYIRAAQRVQPSNLLDLTKKRQRLSGYITHFSQAMFSSVRRLRRQLAEGDRLVSQKLKAASVFAPKNRWWVTSKRTSPEKLAAIWQQRKSLAA